MLWWCVSGPWSAAAQTPPGAVVPVVAQPAPSLPEAKTDQPVPELQALFERAIHLFDGKYYELANNCLKQIAERDPNFPGLKTYQDKLAPFLKDLTPAPAATTPDVVASGVVTNLPKKLDPTLLEDRRSLTAADIKADQKETELKSLFDRGVQAFDKAYYPAAKGLFAKMLELDPGSVRAKDYLTRLESLAQEAGTNAPVVQPNARKIAPPRQADVLVQGVWDLVAAEKYDEVITNMTKVIEQDPTLLTAWYQLGWAYWQTGQKEKTVELWKQLELLAPGTPHTYNLLAQVHIGQGQMQEGADYLNKSLALDPSQYWARFAKARVMLWSGRATEAIPLLKALAVEQPDDVRVRIQLAHAYDQDRQYEQALEQWGVLRKAYPDNPNFLLGEARQRLGNDDLEGAARNAQELLDKKVFETDAHAINFSVAEYGLSHDPAKAIPKMREIIDRVDATNVVTRMQLLNRLMTLQISKAKEDPLNFPMKEAIKTCDVALKIDPHSMSFILSKGELLLINGEALAAEEQFNQVLKGNPNDSEQPTNPQNRRALAGLFGVYMARQLFDQAEEALNKVAVLNPKDPYLHYNRAILAEARGETPEAYKELDRLEREGARGSILMLLYHGLTISDSTALLSVWRFRETLLVLKKNGFRFITPDEMPDYFAGLKDPLEHKASETSDAEEDVAQQTKALRDYTPPKMVSITFDDALRSSFRFGTSVAEELDLRFAMNVPVGEVLDYNPTIASWDELRQYQATGRWTFGSHMVNHDPVPVNAQGTHLVRPLANRYWLPAKNRLENQLEYVVRIQREYRLSWELLHKELKMSGNAPISIAIPMGDIGDEDECNVDNAIQINMAESSARYKLGFHESNFGHAVKGDNTCLYQRHELDRHEDGKAVLTYAYRNHPVYLARRLRAELAALQGRPHLALEMLALLKRDGYPDNLYDELQKYVETHLSNKLEAPAHAVEQESKKSPWHLELKEPYIGIGGSHVKDNEESQANELFIRAGVNVTPNLTVEGRFAPMGSYKRSSNVYNTLQTTSMQTSTNTTQTTTTSGSATTVETSQSINGTQTTVYTNIVTTTDFSCDIVTMGGRINYRLESGGNFSLGAFQHAYTSTTGPTNSAGQLLTNKIDGAKFLGAFASVSGKPTLVTEAALAFQRDAIPSLQGPIAENTVAVNGMWEILDPWELSGRVSFSSLSDDNSLLFLNAKSLWRLSEEQGFFAGFGGEFANAGNKSLDYWTPHWLERVYLMAEVRRSYLKSFFQVGLRFGWGKSSGWEADVEHYNANLINSQLWSYYPGPNPDQPWTSIVGVNASISKKFWRYWELNFNGSVDAMESYMAHNLAVELLYHF